MNRSQQTILAISSPPGRSYRGLLRVTGPELGIVVEQLFDQPLQPRILSVTRLFLQANKEGQESARGSGDKNGVTQQVHPTAYSTTLPCLAVYWPGPHSYTGEDVLEIQLPGNPALLDCVMQYLLSKIEFSRLAEPGEFTQRSFLAGKIDLTRAEGIAATISAVCDAQLQAADLLRHGKLGMLSESLVEQLAQGLALVEAGIDFTDQEDVVPISPRNLDEQLDGIEKQLSELLNRSRAWSQLEALPQVVLVGYPNVGKSTLFNALLGHERAVISNFAGTTRDLLCEPLRIKQGDHEAEVLLVDIAGLDVANGLIDQAMQQQATQAIDHAELVLLLDDGIAGWPVVDTDADVLKVRTKCDLSQGSQDGVECAISAVTGQGLAELRSMIAKRMQERAVSLAGQMLALQPRHYHALNAALEQITLTRQMLADHLDEHALPDMELVACHLRPALDHLGELGGQISPDDVIGKVFATFCVGK